MFLRNMRRAAAVAVLVIVVLCFTGTAVFAQSFDDILGKFAQRRSGVCVLYAHAMAMAETNPAAFKNLIRQSSKAWTIKLNGGKYAYVTPSDIENSIKNGFSAGEPDNLITIFCIGVSKLSRGFNYNTGELDYGTIDGGWMQFVGSGQWTLYDNEQKEPDRTLKDGLDKLAKITGPDGRPSVPCTMGFGALDEKTIPKYAKEVEKVKLVGGHDFSVARYDAARRIVVMRNPHNPTALIEAPVDLLLKIPAGIDFMDKPGAYQSSTTACK